MALQAVNVTRSPVNYPCGGQLSEFFSGTPRFGPFLARQSGGKLASQTLPLSAHLRLPDSLLRVFPYDYSLQISNRMVGGVGWPRRIL